MRHVELLPDETAANAVNHVKHATVARRLWSTTCASGHRNANDVGREAAGPELHALRAENKTSVRGADRERFPRRHLARHVIRRGFVFSS